TIPEPPFHSRLILVSSTGIYLFPCRLPGAAVVRPGTKPPSDRDHRPPSPLCAKGTAAGPARPEKCHETVLYRGLPPVRHDHDAAGPEPAFAGRHSAGNQILFLLLRPFPPPATPAP